MDLSHYGEHAQVLSFHTCDRFVAEFKAHSDGSIDYESVVGWALIRYRFTEPHIRGVYTDVIALIHGDNGELEPCISMSNFVRVIARQEIA